MSSFLSPLRGRFLVFGSPGTRWLVTLLLFFSLVSFSPAKPPELLDRPFHIRPKIEDRKDRKPEMIDVREVLTRLTTHFGLSLIAAKKVRGFVELPLGPTGGETLKKCLHPLGFAWEERDGCLFVGTSESLLAFKEAVGIGLKLPVRKEGMMNAEFYDVELSSIIRVLRHFSGVEVMADENLTGRMTMRIVNMPWERVLLGIIHLNGFRLVESDFSLMIVP